MNNLEEYKPLLLPDEVCEILRISKSSFYKKVWLGQIPVIKLGKSIRVDKAKLLNLLNENSRGTGILDVRP